MPVLETLEPLQCNGYRNCEAAHLERLSFIRHCRALEKQLVQLRAHCAGPGLGERLSASERGKPQHKPVDPAL